MPRSEEHKAKMCARSILSELADGPEATDWESVVYAAPDVARVGAKALKDRDPDGDPIEDFADAEYNGL